MTVLAAGGLCVARGKRRIIQNLSFAAFKGEVIGVIGPNGSGKSTLLSCLAGLLPYSGTLSFSGRDAHDLTLAERALAIAYVPQDREVAWPLKIEEVVALGREPHRSRFLGYDPGGAAAAEAAIDALDLQALRHQPISSVSGGERARALIARAFAQEAPLLLADEPCAGLDPAHQLSLMQCLKAQAAAGQTILVALHELPLAAQWCSRLLLLHRGTLVAYDKPDQVLSDEHLDRIYGIRAHRVTADGLSIPVPASLSLR